MKYKNYKTLKFNIDLEKNENVLKKICNIFNLQNFIVEIFMFDDVEILKNDLEIINFKYEFLKLNQNQYKCVVNLEISKLKHLLNIFSKYKCEELNIWNDVNLDDIINDNIIQTSFYLNYNKEENKTIEITYNTKKYINLPNPKQICKFILNQSEMQ